MTRKLWQYAAYAGAYLFCLSSCSKPEAVLPDQRPDNLGASARVASAKRGISYWIGGQAAIDGLGPQTWYYNWSPDPDTQSDVTLPAGSTFVPMVWDETDMTTEKINKAKANSPSNTLLTFNEPDLAEQAGMSVSSALSFWPTLMATGMRLGSPAVAFTPSTSTWLRDFMQGAAANGYRVDFICLHYYYTGDPVTKANEVIADIERVYNLYHKPIWITEFALTWGSNSTVAQESLFMQTILPKLEALPYVEKYAWWSLSNGPNAAAWSLTNTDGSINTLGTLYNTFPNATPANLLANAGFEAGASQTPANWITWSSTNTPDVDYTESINGNHSGAYHLTHYRGQTGTWNCYTYQVFNGLANGSYTFSGWARANGAGIVSQLEAKDYGGAKVALPIPASSAYQLVQGTVNVTNGSCTIGLWTVVTNGSNWPYAFLDDVSFVKN